MSKNPDHKLDELSILLYTNVTYSKHGPFIDIWYLTQNIGRLNKYEHISWIHFKSVCRLYSKYWLTFEHSWC